MLKKISHLLSSMTGEYGLATTQLEVLVGKLEQNKLLYKGEIRQKPLFLVKYIFLEHEGMHQYAGSCLNKETVQVYFCAPDFKLHFIQIRLSVI